MELVPVGGRASCNVETFGAKELQIPPGDGPILRGGGNAVLNLNSGAVSVGCGGEAFRGVDARVDVRGGAQ